MTALHAIEILVAGLWAGTINAVVGSGTLVTFPVLLFLGYPPITANVSNNIGLVAGGFGSIRGYREELAGHGGTLRTLMPASAAGSITGALLLLVLPADAFKAIVPMLILLALVLVITGPRLQKRFAELHAEAEAAEGGGPSTRMPLLLAGVFVAGVYGGYFGAAQGVLLIGIMSVLLAEPLQRINAFKNVLGTCVNAVAALVFIVVAWHKIDWQVAGLIAVGALAGGYLGARIGRKLPPQVLRGLIVVIGVIAIVKIVFYG
ncbi:MAG: sulfite exporter TauE/SafE family protein [Patulibacter sp.]|nr:sulfite exporter TauE/SafE family protein [Patulibacter sp.]